MNTTPRYLLDTNIWSALIRRTDASLIKRFGALQRNQVLLSPIVWGELQLGYYKGDRSAKRQQVIDHIAASTDMLTLDSHVSTRYAQVRAGLEMAGTPIGPNDTWIAAEALCHQLVLVTDNIREFERVPKLILENWLQVA